MSDPAPDPGGLQFDRAETPGAPMVCSLCKAAVSGAYFTLNASPFCSGCRDQVQAELSGSGPSLARLAKAGLLGLAASAAGAGIWFGVMLATDAEWGIVAVVVGLMVGLAVRRGSSGLGGPPYQIMAMALTYAAVVAAYMGLHYKMTRDMAPVDDALRKAEERRKDLSEEERKQLDEARRILKPGFLDRVKFAAGIPFQKGNFLGLLIIGFAIFEAWRINRRVALVFQGPFNSPSAGTGAGGV